MKNQIVGAIIGMMVLAGTAMADCKHIEYAELQDMSAKDAQIEYCVALVEIKYNNLNIDSLLAHNKKILSIPGGLGMDVVDQNDKEISRISRVNMACSDEKARILKRLSQLKIDKAQAEASCLK